MVAPETLQDELEPEVDPDRDLVLACQDALRAGRTPPFEELYARHHARVYRQCRRFLGNDPDARDACQDTFVRVLSKLPGFQRRGRFAGWLHHVARNCCRELARGSLRARRGGGIRSGTEREVAARRNDPVEDSPEAGLFRCELQALVERSLARLSPVLRSVVVPRYFEPCSYEEIAARLGISIGTVKSRLFHAHEALEHELARNPDLDELLVS